MCWNKNMFLRPPAFHMTPRDWHAVLRSISKICIVHKNKGQQAAVCIEGNVSVVTDSNYSVLKISKFVLFKKTSVDFSLDVGPTAKMFLLLALVFLTTASVANAQNCTSSADCSRADGEQCRHGTCSQTIASSRNVSADRECQTNGDCLTSQVCCYHRCVQNWNCLRENCSLHTDCQLDERCCHGTCRENGECAGIIGTVIVCSVAFILIVAICYSGCRNIISNRQRFRFPWKRKPEMRWNESTAILIFNEITD